MIQYKIAAAAGAQSATFGTGTATDDVTLGLVAMTASQANQAPTITSANSTTFTVGTDASFTVTTTGNPTPSLSETGALPSGVTFKDNGNGTATLTETPAAGTPGTYPITFTASNGVGTAATPELHVDHQQRRISSGDHQRQQYNIHGGHSWKLHGNDDRIPDSVAD